MLFSRSDISEKKQIEGLETDCEFRFQLMSFGVEFVNYIKINGIDVSSSEHWRGSGEEWRGTGEHLLLVSQVSHSPTEANQWTKVKASGDQNLLLCLSLRALRVVLTTGGNAGCEQFYLLVSLYSIQNNWLWEAFVGIYTLLFDRINDI